jgi:hypothetical protein
MFEMLGLLVEYFPATMDQFYPQYMKLALDTLERQLKSEKPEPTLITGVLDCITSLLTRCDESEFPGGKRVKPSGSLDSCHANSARAPFRSMVSE